MGESQNNKTTTLVLVGKTGNGKSATGNSILGRKAFVEKCSSRSVTKKCELKSAVWEDGDGRTLNVVDTPGLFDTNVDQKYVAKEIVNCIKLAKDGVHGILLVTSVVNRFTPEEAAIFDFLQLLFGPKITDYVVVVFTRGDDLGRDGMTLQEHLEDSPQTLKNLLRRYDNRMILFNNRGDSQTKKAQLTELLKQIDTVVTVNGGKPYSNEMFHQFQDMTAQFGGQPSCSGPLEKGWNEQVSLMVQMMENNMAKLIAVLEKQLSAERDRGDRLERENKGKCWPL